MKLKEAKCYEIYTDASFDENSKLATYAVVVTKEEKILEVFAKRCKLKVEKSTECEIFAIYQAINIILTKYVNEYKYQKFLIKTDCQSARDFFVCKEMEIKAFEYNPEIAVMMTKVYEKLSRKMSRKMCSFKIRWISEKQNKIAHQYTHTAFQKVRKNMTQANKSGVKDEIVVLEKQQLLNMINKLSSNQRKVLSYLMESQAHNGMLQLNKEQIAKSLNLSIHTMTRAISMLKKLHIIEVNAEKTCEMLI